MQRYLRGQIWWCNCSYDVNSTDREYNSVDSQKMFDHIQKGMRPVLIISNNTGNKHSETLQIIPCTSSEKISLPTHCVIYINKIKNTLLCEQTRTVNKSDISSYLITLDDKELSEVEKCVQIALGLIKPTQYEKIVVEMSKNDIEDKSTIIKKEG